MTISRRGEVAPIVAALGRGRGPYQRFGHVKSLAGTLAATGAIVPPALAMRLAGHPQAGRLPMRWHRLISRALGVRTHMLGAAPAGPTLIVCNHLSWLDIPVLGSHLPGSFVAKAEVETMGVLGYLAGLQDTIYVERAQRRRAADQASEIASRLQRGGNVILFPEGTSGDGVGVLPFKSTLFSVLDAPDMADVAIQPVTLAYIRLNGLPITRHRLMDITWVGDMEFAPHALDVMRIGRLDAAILPHAPVRRADFADRKALAVYCREVIAEGYRRLIRGCA